MAEDILQDGFVRAEESAVAWFYRLLRNALVDHFRRRATEDRALAAVATESATPEADAELHETICACIRDLIETLKPEYAAALRRVELEGEKVDAFSRSVGITATNASVRLHRAREALRRRVIESCGTCVAHGCRDCECGEPQRHRSSQHRPAPRSC